jgi:hypothetical protein
MSHAIRRLAAILALAAFAFAQLAVSAYACPMTAQPAMQDQPAPDAQGGCPEFSSANLCEQHCAYGSASVGSHADSVPAPDLAPLPWGVSGARVAEPPSFVPARHRARSTAAPPPERPLPLRI